jgi:hypothetical protein
VTVTLTVYEAWSCSRCSTAGEDADAIDPVLMPGEQTALWALSCRLESILTEPFARNYRELVDQAQQRLAERGGR